MFDNRPEADLITPLNRDSFKLKTRKEPIKEYAAVVENANSNPGNSDHSTTISHWINIGIAKEELIQLLSFYQNKYPNEVPNSMSGKLHSV